MLCEKLFSNIVSSPHDKLAELLHAENRNSYNLRHNRKFNIKRTKTNRFKNSFIMHQAQMNFKQYKLQFVSYCKKLS